eukprot:14757678-Alexandrium_andersonii.AAC.1
MLKESREQKISFVGGLDYEQAELVAFYDAAFANVDDPKLGDSVRSQCGIHVMLASPGAMGAPVAADSLLWEPHSAKRVVRSTLAAEAYA